MADNATISKESKTFGRLIAGFGDTVKKQIDDSLDANEGFSSVNVLDTAFDRSPKPLLLLQGIDLDKPGVKDKIRAELTPDADILASQIQGALADGFSTAGRLAAQTAAVFVALGALSSLMLPNRKRQLGEPVVAMAH